MSVLQIVAAEWLVLTFGVVIGWGLCAILTAGKRTDEEEMRQ